MNNSNAKLTKICIERFKSFEQRTEIDIAPLTVIVGRNNSGKSSLIQSVLLLKQTLADRNPDVMLQLDGIVDALNLRELTFKPKSLEYSAEKLSEIDGPIIKLTWESEVNIKETLDRLSSSAASLDKEYLARLSKVQWFESPPDTATLCTSIEIITVEREGNAEIKSIDLCSIDVTTSKTLADAKIERDGKGWKFSWKGTGQDEYVSTDKIQVELDHFIPYLINASAVRKAKERTWYSGFMILFAEPLKGLKDILVDLHYLDSIRQRPPSIFKVSTTARNDIGVNGEFAAQLLYARKGDIVHFLKPVEVDSQSIAGVSKPILVSDEIIARPLEEAVNLVFDELSVKEKLNLDAVRDIGFRLLFGTYTLAHVGRGLSYLLPLVELGLFSDPLRYSGEVGEMSLDEYRDKCKSFTHIAIEEPEAHLHPKVASCLAHWLVSLARANRRIMVETHSDHLVRRLRGLVARAESGSEFEKWLLENVVILSVEQNEHGQSSVTSSRLTKEGGVEDKWSADFMDESSDEESAIYYAKLDKRESISSNTTIEFVDGDEPEVDEAL